MTRCRVVDIETTGMSPSQGAEVVELAMQDVVSQPDGSEARLSGEVRSWLYRTERPSPPEVLAVHHILPHMTADCELFDLAHSDATMTLVTQSAPDYYVAHNAEFEMDFLGGWSDPAYQSPAPAWICTYKAALRVWPDAPSHSNQALMYWQGLHEDMEEEARQPPHRAGPDAHVTAHILVRLLRHATLQQMAEWTLEPRLLPKCTIGKFRGVPWPQVDRGFLDWMLKQADMGADLKWNARRELERRRTVALAGA